MTEFFNSGWEFGGQTSAAAKAGDEGGAFSGAMSVSPGIWLYQLTDDGLALELTGKGTKYYKDDDLNWLVVCIPTATWLSSWAVGSHYVFASLNKSG